MKCYFRSHRCVTLNDEQKERLERCIKKVVKNYGVDEFIFHEIFKTTKETFFIFEETLQAFPFVKTTFYIDRASFNVPKLKSQKDFVKLRKSEYLQIFVDEIKTFEIDCRYPESDILLNYHIIDESDICIFFFDYKTIARRAGVTAHAYNYAKKKGKKIFNIAYR